MFVFTQYYDESSSSITFNDIMSIDSEDAFFRQMFKHKYSTTDNGKFKYALNPSEDGKSTSFASYYPSLKTFWFEFVRKGTVYTGTPQEKSIVVENVYDKVFNKVERRCKFVRMETDVETTYALYDCKKAKFDSYIGFTISNSTGVITTFVKDN